MRISIDAHHLPGRHLGEHRDVWVGVQRRGRNDDVLQPVAADAAVATWELEATTSGLGDSLDVRGPYLQGRPGARFLYLSWGTLDAERFTMFGRSKLLLSAVPADTLAAAVASGTLTGSVSLADDRGRPRMAAITPPAVVWSAG